MSYPTPPSCSSSLSGGELSVALVFVSECFFFFLFLLEADGWVMGVDVLGEEEEEGGGGLFARGLPSIRS